MMSVNYKTRGQAKKTNYFLRKFLLISYGCNSPQRLNVVQMKWNPGVGGGSETSSSLEIIIGEQLAPKKPDRKLGPRIRKQVYCSPECPRIERCPRNSVI